MLRLDPCAPTIAAVCQHRIIHRDAPFHLSYVVRYCRSAACSCGGKYGATQRLTTSTGAIVFESRIHSCQTHRHGSSSLKKAPNCIWIVGIRPTIQGDQSGRDLHETWNEAANVTAPQRACIGAIGKLRERCKRSQARSWNCRVGRYGLSRACPEPGEHSGARKHCTEPGQAQWDIGASR